LTVVSRSEVSCGFLLTQALYAANSSAREPILVPLMIFVSQSNIRFKKKTAKSENSLCFLLGHVFVVDQRQSSIIGSQLALTVGNHQKRVVSRTKAKVSVFVRKFEKLVQIDVNLRSL
jgi:hypothetical protein